MKLMSWLMVLVMAGVMGAQGASFGLLTADEAALHGGATHLVVLEDEDLTTSTTNTAQSFTGVVSVAANSSVRFVAMELYQAFDSGNTNYTGSTLLKVGDGEDDDRYLTSTELNSDGTEVWVKFSPDAAGTITVTPQTTSINSITNIAVGTLIITNGATAVTVVTTATHQVSAVTVATNATASFSGSAVGYRVYTAATNLTMTVTPNAEEAVSALTQGQVRLYLQMFDAR